MQRQKRSQSTNETGVCGFLKSHVVYFAYYKCDVTLWSEIQNSRQTCKNDSLLKPSWILIWNMNSSLSLHIFVCIFWSYTQECSYHHKQIWHRAPTLSLQGTLNKLMFIPQSTTQATSRNFYPIFTFAATEKKSWQKFRESTIRRQFYHRAELDRCMCTHKKTSPNSLSDVNQNLSYMNDSLF